MTAGIANCCCALELEWSSRSVPKREETKVDPDFCAISMVGLMRTNMDQHRLIWRTKYGPGMAPSLTSEFAVLKHEPSDTFSMCSSWVFLPLFFITIRNNLISPPWGHVSTGEIKLYFLSNTLRVVSNFAARKERSKYTHTRYFPRVGSRVSRLRACFPRSLVSCRKYRLPTVYLTNKGPSFSKTCAVVSKVKASDRPWRDGGKQGILSGCKPT